MDIIFPHRIARLSYLVRNVAIATICAVMAPQFDNRENYGVGVAAIVCALLITVYWGAFVIAPRCRDTGMSPWTALLILVPGLNIFVAGYLTWKKSWPAMDGLLIACESPAATSGGIADHGSDGKSDARRKLEALRDEGAITEQDFLRRKARLGKNN